MTLVRYEPINLFGRFNDEINRLLAGTQPRDTTGEAGTWSPSVDIREEDSRFVLTADIPGVAREAIDISLEEGVLTISGERAAAGEEPAGGYLRRERVAGAFRRQFTLPETVNSEHISATAKDGVLRIEIPKQEKPQPRRISVS
jgi:HSP20 family protein